MHRFILIVCLFLTAGSARSADTFSIRYENGRVIREFPTRTRPTIGLALSGGGARGAAHIGVIQVLEENGIHVSNIAGSSMGAIVGGMYAGGYKPGPLADIFARTDWSSLFSNTPNRLRVYETEKETAQWPMFEVRFQGLEVQVPSSLSSGQNIISLLSRLTLGATYRSGGDFSRLPIPFRAVATDLQTGDMVGLSTGNLGRAIQASSTVPLLFAPVTWDRRLLVDGGLKNNLPVSEAREMGSDFVIAVAIDESMHKAGDLDNPLNIADQATSILIRNITDLYRGEANYVIAPNMEAFSSRDFLPIEAMIEQGRIAARAAVRDIKDLLAVRSRAYRRAVVSGITVSPREETLIVRRIMEHYFEIGTSAYYADIAAGLEDVWDRGRYIAIHAEINPDNNIMHIELTGMPTNVTFTARVKGESDRYITRYELVMPPDDPMDIKTLVDRVDSLMYHFGSEGYVIAEITETQYNPLTRHMTVVAEVPKVSGVVLDEGLNTRRSVITREFEFQTGEPLNLNQLMSSVDNLYGTNLFEWVYADLEPREDGVEVLLHLKEKNWSVARIGLRYDETNQAEGRLEFSQENILGLGNDFSLLGESGPRNKLMMIENQNDRIWKTLYTFDVSLYHTFRKRAVYTDHNHDPDYEEKRYGTVISIGQQMGKLGNVLLRFRAERAETKFAPGVPEKHRTYELRSFMMQTVIDTYDRYPFPLNGMTHTIHIESASEFAGGTSQFVKLYWGGNYAHTFARKHTLTGGFSLGSADPSTPAIESFGLGGTPTRLNCFDDAGPRTRFYAPFPGLFPEEFNGNYLAVGSISYRLFIPRYFHLTLTYAAGNVWKNDSAITRDTLRQGYGIEGAFDTYFGPLTFGWGTTDHGDDRISMSAGWEF